jgi:hypothetical protein
MNKFDSEVNIFIVVSQKMFQKNNLILAIIEGENSDLKRMIHFTKLNGKCE